MRVLVVFAHPVDQSFSAAIHREVVAALKARGHEVDDCDLNAEKFDPVMSAQDRIEYHDTAINRTRVAPYVDRLLRAEALVMVYPVWNMGFPAILKGYVDKVFLPGVSFEMDPDGGYRTTLRNIKRLSAVCTYGGSHLRTFLAGDPMRRFFKRSLRAVVGLPTPCDYLALYDMNHTTPEARAAFLARVRGTFAAY